MKARQGFTLIELLVVISIIAVLMGILMPSLRMARMHAQRIVSTSHLRQIGIGLELYAEDHRGFFPETSHGLTGSDARERSWVNTLSPYVGDVNEIRICPADPNRSIRLEAGTTSYVMNEYVATDPVDPFGRMVGKSYRNKHRLRRPDQTITTFIGADSLSASITSDHTHSRQWFLVPDSAWDTIGQDIQPDRFYSRRNADNTHGSSLYLYADGRVENIQAETVKEWADQDTNFAEPP